MRRFVPHSAQLVSVALRPVVPPSVYDAPPEDIKPRIYERPDVHMASPPKRAPSEDAQSDFDPLFDDAPDSGDGGHPMDMDADDPLGAPMRVLPAGFTLSMPSVQPAQPVVAAPIAQPAPPPPKHGPPLLDSTNAPAFSADVLMTASFDGQVVLWDRRVAAGGGTGSHAKGVGRLWMHDKTPRWCVSVSRPHNTYDAGVEADFDYGTGVLVGEWDADIRRAKERWNRRLGRASVGSVRSNQCSSPYEDHSQPC